MTATSGFYRRPHPMTERLIAAVVQTLREHPTERLGQLLCNALDLRNELDRATDLFDIRDEDMAEHLAVYCENEPDAFGCEYGHLSNGGCALAATADSPPPTSIQLLDVTDELVRTTVSLRDALDLLEAFDKYAVATMSDSQFEAGYAGSPFATQVQSFLAENGR